MLMLFESTQSVINLLYYFLWLEFSSFLQIIHCILQPSYLYPTCSCSYNYLERIIFLSSHSSKLFFTLPELQNKYFEVLSIVILPQEFNDKLQVHQSLFIKEVEFYSPSTSLNFDWLEIAIRRWWSDSKCLELSFQLLLESCK